MEFTTLFSVFANSILPILIIAALGYILARNTHADVRTLSVMTFNILSPALILNTLITSTISPIEFGRMAGFTFCVIVVAGLVAWLIARALRLDRQATSAFITVAMFANAGNFGLPLILFAFGPDALTRATVYFVIHVILLYSLGILLASSGKLGWQQSFKQVLRVPHFYAIGVAIIFMFIKIPVPDGIMRSITLLNNAAFAIMILLMGMQLQRAKMPARPIVVGIATALRLIVLPILAFGIALLFGLTGPDRQAAVIQASMPAAVMISVLAVQFESAPDFVTAVVFISTILSPVTLTVLVAMLQ